MPINIAAFKNAKDVKTAKSFDEKSYPKLGDYLYRLDTFKCKQDRKGLDVMVAEFTVVHVFDTVEGKPSHKVGEEVNKITKQVNDYYVKDIKAIICSCTGCSDDQIGQEEILQAFGFDAEGNPLEDGAPLDGNYITIRVTTREVEKRDTPGEYFSITNFKPAFTPEELLEVLSDEVMIKYYSDTEGNNVLEAMLG